MKLLLFAALGLLAASAAQADDNFGCAAGYSCDPELFENNPPRREWRLFIIANSGDRHYSAPFATLHTCDEAKSLELTGRVLEDPAPDGARFIPPARFAECLMRDP
jgi:hypothetical protein